MVRIGNFLFHYRNALFPVFYILLFAPAPPVFDSDVSCLLLGFWVAIAGQATRVLTIGLKYIVRGGKNRRVHADDLVTEGIFNHCRNPLYVGNVLMLIGLAIMANTSLSVFFLIPLFLFFYQAIIRAEENFLIGKFGEQMHAYMARVNRWVPNFSGLEQTVKSMEFNWRRVLIKEYNATFLWMMGAVLMTIYKTGGFQSARFAWGAPWTPTMAVLFALYLGTRVAKKTKLIVE